MLTQVFRPLTVVNVPLRAAQLGWVKDLGAVVVGSAMS